jgi:hypothetical protein
MFKAQRPSLASMTEQQRDRVTIHMERQIATQHRLYYQCPVRDCRRRRECAGTDRSCLRGHDLPPLSNKKKKRLKHAFRNAPWRR